MIDVLWRNVPKNEETVNFNRVLRGILPAKNNGKSTDIGQDILYFPGGKII